MTRVSLFVFKYEYGSDDAYLLDNTPGCINKPHLILFKRLSNQDSFSYAISITSLSGGYV